MTRNEVISAVCVSTGSIFIFFFPYQSWPLLLTRCRCRGYCGPWSQWHISYTLGETPLDKGSVLGDTPIW